MIAQRLRPIGWVAAVAVAALTFYLVSLRVAAERGALEAVDRQIVYAQRDIRRLQTELGTRASLRQLERWNGEALALSAPRAGQYLESEFQLAAFDADQPAQVVPAAPGPAQPVIRHAVVTRELPAKPPAAAVTRTAALSTSDAAPPARLQTVAMITPGTMGEIVRRAEHEAGIGER